MTEFDVSTEEGAMNEAHAKTASRRQFLVAAGRTTGASALAGIALPPVHAAGTNTIQVAVVGCGGRGTGAAINALSVKNGPTKLVAMADVVSKKLSDSYDKLKSQFAGQVDVPPERRFLGFEAYREAMDCLKAGDVIILATPPAFRWVHFSYAIGRGLHTFMEKPVTVDGPTTRRMLKLGELSVQKNLKVGVGLMVRHCRARQQMLERVRAGQIGDILFMRAYRMTGLGGLAPRTPAGASEVMHQVQHFHAFLWASGGVFSDYNIHQIDECSWFKGAWPVQAHAVGGRHYRRDSVDQNFDAYSVEYTYPDGAMLLFDGRTMAGCRNEFGSYVHGTKGSAVITTLAHSPSFARILKGHRIPRILNRKELPPPEDPDVVWAAPRPELSPYQTEWDELMQAIREDRPFNEVQRGAEASMVTSMGRMAAHTGQLITYEQMLNCAHEFAPSVDKLTADGPAPLVADADGKYPVPQPGIKKDREF